MPSDSAPGRNYDLSDIHGKSGLSSLTDVFGDRLEQTVGGATVGIVRDAVDAPRTTQQKIDRALQNDMATLIAADTIAIVPKFNALSAGTMRAGLLINPHKPMSENAGSFTLNMAEGAALNQVGKMMLPGSRLQASIGRSLTSPLGRELATHVAVGAGFGTVKTGFAPGTWVDENGHFSPGSAAHKIATGAGAGALFNVPAGIVGVRTMKGSMALMAESQISPRLATTIASAGSGYTSGAVFGGIEAVRHGKGFSETLEEMHFAGKVGLVTGAAIGAADRGSLQNRYRELYSSVARARTVSVQETPVEPVKRGAASLEPVGREKPAGSRAQELVSAGKSREHRASDGKQPRKYGMDDDVVVEELETVGRSRTKLTLSERLDYQPRSDYTVSEMSPRLQNPRVEVETVRVLRPDAKTKFDSFEDFQRQTEAKEIRMRVYEVEGHTAKLAIEEGLAQKMDAARQYRLDVELLAQKEVPFDRLPQDILDRINLEWPLHGDHRGLLRKYMSDAHADESLSVIYARLKLAEGKVSKTALPEDFIVMLDELPNRGAVKALVLVDEPNPQDAWNRQRFNDPDFVSAATASQDGRITFYLTKDASQVRSTLRTFMGHEFAHLAAKGSPEETSIYGLAKLVDRDVPNPNFRPQTASAGFGDGANPVSVETGKSLSGSDRRTVKYFSREYANTNLEEDGAVHLGEEMLAPNSDRLVALGKNAPVRTVVLASSLRRSMQAALPHERSAHAEVLNERLHYVETEVYPEAMRLLDKRIKTGTLDEQAAALELVGYLGKADRHLPMLRKVASDAEMSRIVPQTMPKLVSEGYRGAGDGGVTVGGKRAVKFGPLEEGRTVAEIAFDAMIRLYEGNPSDQLAFLARESMPNSPTRDIALTRLALAKHPAAEGYLGFAKHAGNADSLPRLIDLMDSLPDPQGQTMAFQEALRLGGEVSPKFKESVIKRALEIPGLREQALREVAPDQAINFEVQLRAVAKQSPDKNVRQQANNLLANMTSEAYVVRAIELMRGDNPRGVMQGIEQVLNSRGNPDRRLILPLLEVKHSGSEALSRAAEQALMRFNQQLVKFYSQQLKKPAAK